METIGSRIKNSRIKMNYSQVELANETGLSLRSITAYENDAAIPRSRTLYRLAIALSVTTNYLETGIEDDIYIDAQNLLNQNKALFSGGRMTQQDKDSFFNAVMAAYVKCKKESEDRLNEEPDSFR